LTAIDGYRTARALCVLAPNPSPMTLDGTNTWIVAEAGSPDVVVIDPGPLDEGHLRRILTMTGDRRVRAILLTHGHPDHSAGAARFAELSGCAVVRAADPAHRLGDEGLAEGDVIDASGCELRVIASPGHSADSVSLLLTGDGALLTGDTVLGRGTTVIAGDGNLGDYLRTLDRLQGIADVRVLLPGHGPPLDDPAGTLEYYIAHRAERLDQVRAALTAGARTPAEIVAMIYTDVDKSVWPAAEWSVQAQLDYLGQGLPGAFAQALGVQDQHRTSGDLQPAPGREVGQCLVDGLPGRADQLGQFLLGEVVVDVQAIVFLLAEPVGQVQQVLRHPAGHVGEHEVGVQVVGPAQPPGQRLQHVHGHLGALIQPGPQRLVGERGKRRVGDRAGRGGPRPRVE
jgi:glyoxylase-like metal-dependent hydrolase (beta-lactamase superfamily II)